jgi:hypothetical protein
MHIIRTIRYIYGDYFCFRKWYAISKFLISITFLLLLSGSAIWDYNSPCLTPEKSRAKLVYMVQAFTEIMTELNITHWVDYGTLIGALRYENINIWDHDADVSFERKFANLLHNGGIAQKIAKNRYNIHLNAAVMLYEGMQTDIYSWKKQRISDGNFVYTKAANRDSDLFESQFNDFNASFIEKTVLIPFAGGFVRAPYPPMEFIKQRYSLSYNRIMPYKVSCYFFWNIPYWLFNRPIHEIS